MNIAVLVIDRLHAGSLGCYGNAWVASPHFNRLASESFLFDQAFVDHPDVAELCQSWWTGTHYYERRIGRSFQLSIADQLSQAGYLTTCLTDDLVVAEHPLVAGFDEVIRCGAAAGAQRSAEMAESIEETELGHFFAAATEWLDQPREPFFLWLHSRGLGSVWDAPYSYRSQYAEQDEAEPPELISPPSRFVTEADDPDELWGVAQAYAGQVALLDECLGGFIEMLEAEQLARDTVLVVIGARGFPLGRNGRLGPIDTALYSELVQTPLLIRLPDGTGAMARSQSLVQPGDLGTTLAELAGLASDPLHLSRSLLPVVGDGARPLRDYICLAGNGGEGGFRTPAWYLRLPGGESSPEGQPPELYAKPDDRWEVNDVATRCPEIVAAMQAANHAARKAIEAGQPFESVALEESLVSDLR